MDDTPSESREIVNVDAITNVDTARMALRWALERLQKLDQHNKDLGQAVEAEGKLREKALAELSALQKTLSLRQSETDQRELYYAKLEEFLTLRLQGQVDVKALAEREVEARRLQELLEHKAVELEKQHQARTRQLEKEHERLRFELEASHREREKQAEQATELRRKALEQEHLSKSSELRDKEALLRQEERALAERQTHFEQYYETQRERLQSELKNFRVEIDEQVKLRSTLAERAFEERHAAIEGAWAREKALLLKELETWRAQSQELAPRIIELERQVAIYEEKARRAQADADLRALQLAERTRGLQDEQAALSNETGWWKKQLSDMQSQAVSLQEKLAAAEAGNERLRIMAQADVARLEERLRAYIAERDAIADAAQDWKSRAEAATTRAIETEKKLETTEENARLVQGASERDVTMIGDRAAATEREKEALVGEIGEWRKRTEAAHARAIGLQTKVSGLEEAANRLRAELDGAEARAAERAQAWEAERRHLSEAADAARQRSLELETRLQDLERSLAAIEENHGITDRQLSRMDQQHRGWEQERESLVAEIAELRTRAQEDLPKRLALEKALAVAEEATIKLRAAGERQAARFDEQRKAWDEEKAELLALRDQLHKTVADQSLRLAEMVRRFGYPPQQKT